MAIISITAEKLLKSLHLRCRLFKSFITAAQCGL
jgi:hypothetical protein